MGSPLGIDWRNENRLGTMSDPDLAKALSDELGFRVTANAVCKARARYSVAAFNPIARPPNTLRSQRWAEEDDEPTTERPKPVPPAVSHALAPQPKWISRALLIPDVHAPYHDRLAWRVMMLAAQEFRPNAVIVSGDFADHYSLSRFDKDPKRAQRVDVELCEVCDLLDELDALGARDKVYVMGNHEARWSKMLKRAAPAMEGVVPSYEEYVGLERREWHVVPYGEAKDYGDMMLTHDLDRHGMYAAHHARREAEQKIVIGHVHNMMVAWLKGMYGASFGWLGDVDLIDYRHKERAIRDWQHGFGLGWLEPDGTSWIQPVPIVDGRCCVEGRIIAPAVKLNGYTPYRRGRIPVSPPEPAGAVSWRDRDATTESQRLYEEVERRGPMPTNQYEALRKEYVG